MTSILVVCEGNICRSPMAQAMLSASLPEWRIESAGLSALIGEAADPNATLIMRELGLDISAHRARQLNRAICLSANLVFVMDDNQRQRLLWLYPEAGGRVFRLGHYSDIDVPDPHKQDLVAFRSALDAIERGIAEWLPRLKNI